MKSAGYVSTGVLILLLGAAGPAFAQQGQQNQDPKAQKQAQPAKPAPQHAQTRAGSQGQAQNQGQQPHAQAKPATRGATQATPAARGAAQAKPAARGTAQATPAARTQGQRAPVKPAAARPQQTFGGAYHGGVKANAPTYGGVHPSGVPQQQAQVRSGFLESRATSWNREHRTWQQRGGYHGYRVPDNRYNLYFGSGHVFRIASLPMVFVGGYPRFQYDGYWVTLVDPWPETWTPTWFQSDDVYLEYDNDGYYMYDRAHPGVGIAVTIAF